MIPALAISGLNSAKCMCAFTKKSSKYHPLALKKYVRFTIFFCKKKVQHGLGLTSFALEAEIIYNPIPSKETQNSFSDPPDPKSLPSKVIKKVIFLHNVLKTINKKKNHIFSKWLFFSKRKLFQLHCIILYTRERPFLWHK